MHHAGHIGIHEPLLAVDEDRDGSADLGAAEEELWQVNAGLGWVASGR